MNSVKGMSRFPDRSTGAPNRYRGEDTETQRPRAVPVTPCLHRVSFGQPARRISVELQWQVKESGDDGELFN